MNANSTPKFLDDKPQNTRARRIASVRALITFYGLTQDEASAAFAEVADKAAAGRRPCPACPDGYLWTAYGPTLKPCPTCLGHAWVALP